MARLIVSCCESAVASYYVTMLAGRDSRAERMKRLNDRLTGPGDRRLRLRVNLGLGRDNWLLFWAHLLQGGAFAVQATLWTLFIRSLGANSQQIGAVVGGAVVARTILAVPAGMLIDQISPKPVIVGASILPVIGTLLFIAATEWWHALAGALVLELSAIAIPAVSVYIAATTAEHKRTHAYTYIFTIATQIGMTIMPVFGGLLADSLGFRAVYAVSAALFASSIGFFVLLHGTTARKDADKSNDATGPSPSYRYLLTSPAVRVVVAFHLFVPLLPFVAIALLPNFLNEVRDLSYSTIGLLGSMGSAAGLAVSLLISHWRRLSQPFVSIGLCLGLISLSFAILLSSGTFGAIVIAYMLRSTVSPVWSLMAAAVAHVTPERLRGRAYGLCELNVGVGDIAAPLLSGTLYARDPFLPLWFGLLTTAPLAAISLIVHRLRSRLAPAMPLRQPSPESR